MDRNPGTIFTFRDIAANVAGEEIGTAVQNTTEFPPIGVPILTFRGILTLIHEKESMSKGTQMQHNCSWLPLFFRNYQVRKFAIPVMLHTNIGNETGKLE